MEAGVADIHSSCVRGKEDFSISEAVQGGLTKESLQTGGKIVQTSSKPLSQGGRSSIAFRVVGDKSHGWVEASALWGGYG